MHTVIEMALYVASMLTLFGGVFVTGAYRRARIGPGYRGDKDGALWFVLPALGALLAGLIMLLGVR